MTQRDVEIPTPDGACTPACTPEGAGPWPAVIMYPDAGGARAVFREMAHGWSTPATPSSLPDIYYRVGSYEPFDRSPPCSPIRPSATGSGLGQRDEGGGDASTLGRSLDFLAGQPEVAAGPGRHDRATAWAVGCR